MLAGEEVVRGLNIVILVGRLFRVLTIGWLMLAAGPVAAQGVAPLPYLTLVVPAAAGSGWDLTAKAMKFSLERERLVDHVAIMRYPGAGGLIGLSQFVAHHPGQGDALLVGGLVMLGSALRDESAITVRDVTPVARLTSEWEVLVTPSTSPFHSLADLREAILRDPAALRWVGGALGGPDQGLVWSIADQFHVSLDEVAYYARAGGGRVSDALIHDRGDVGVSGYAEFAPKLASGEIRLLGVAAPSRVAGIAAPTLREGGIATTMMNWRAVFAAPGISQSQQNRLTDLMAAMVRSESWRGQLRDHRWGDAYLVGNAFSQFIDREQSRWASVVNPPRREGELAIAASGVQMGPRQMIGLSLAIASLVGFAISLAWRLRRRRAASLELELRCRVLDAELKLATAAGPEIKNGIDHDFREWELSGAESDVAWLMLRGLPLREIATMRGTSERTVRQQAQAIYRKAGLDGRSDLAGRVLERFI